MSAVGGVDAVLAVVDADPVAVVASFGCEMHSTASKRSLAATGWISQLFFAPGFSPGIIAATATAAATAATRRIVLLFFAASFFPAINTTAAAAVTRRTAPFTFAPNSSADIVASSNGSSTTTTSATSATQRGRALGSRGARQMLVEREHMR